MLKRDLKLNSLPRYSKESPRFILEEHGHCEVPAGCGGVVFRWRNPQQGIPLSMWLYVAGTYQMFLDGEQPPSGRPIVSWGRHVLGLVISDYDPTHTLLMFAGIYDEKEMIHVHIHGPAGWRVSILSAADGTWKYTQSDPGDVGWMHSDFDDSGWSVMVPKKTRETAQHKDAARDSYRADKLEEFGAEGLGVQQEGAKLWVRRVFVLPAPSFQ